MAAISIKPTENGVSVSIVAQELVFFIGPSPANSLASLSDYERRADEVRAYLVPGTAYDQLLQSVSLAYGEPVANLALALRLGGKRDLSCPNLCIDLVESLTADGRPLYVLSKPTADASLCRSLIRLLDADWVDLWWMGTIGNAQINCDRNGYAIWFKGNGGKEVV